MDKFEKKKSSDATAVTIGENMIISMPIVSSMESRKSNKKENKKNHKRCKGEVTTVLHK